MNESHRLSVHGAVIGFALPVSECEQITVALAFAGATETQAAPTMRYRRSGDPGNRVYVRVDPLRHDHPTPVGSMVSDVIDDVHLSIALHATDFVFIHAGVVGWQGRAIVIPGRSRTGKSTLVEALVRAGAMYLSDEYALVDDDGLIAPYPRPIHLRSEVGRELLDAATVGSVATESLPPGLILCTRHEPGTRFSPTDISPAAAALALYDNSIVAEVNPVAATAAVARIARIAPAVRSDRPDATLISQAILNLVTSRAPLHTEGRRH